VEHEVTMEIAFNLTGLETIEQRTIPLDSSVIYDVIITGGGPAALTAAVYCMRKGVKTGLITLDVGGQVAETSVVENYMGYNHIEGISLVQRFKEQVEQFEIGFLQGYKATRVIDGDIKRVACEDGNTYQAKSLIITTGKRWRRLNVPGEAELTGKGVAYCAICDAPLFKDKDVMVVGGGNSAVEAAIDLAKLATSVTVVQLLPHLTADKVLQDELSKFTNVLILFEHEVRTIHGTQSVDAVTLYDTKNKKETKSKVQGIFIEIGLIPNTELVKDVVALNHNDEIIIDCNCRTSRPGIFAAGDVTSVPYKQIIIAAGEAAKAALSACEYVLLKK